MIARIAKQFTFDAAHFLTGLPPDHPCSRMHGHTYADIAKAWKHVHEMVDHRVLNEVAGLAQPTTEYLAAWIIVQLAAHPMLRTEGVWHVVNAGGAIGDEAATVPVREKCTLLERVIVRESSSTWCEMTVSEVRRFSGKQQLLLPYAMIAGAR